MQFSDKFQFSSRTFMLLDHSFPDNSFTRRYDCTEVSIGGVDRRLARIYFEDIINKKKDDWEIQEEGLKIFFAKRTTGHVWFGLFSNLADCIRYKSMVKIPLR